MEHATHRSTFKQNTNTHTPFDVFFAVIIIITLVTHPLSKNDSSYICTTLMSLKIWGKKKFCYKIWFWFVRNEIYCFLFVLFSVISLLSYWYIKFFSPINERLPRITQSTSTKKSIFTVIFQNPSIKLVSIGNKQIITTKYKRKDSATFNTYLFTTSNIDSSVMMIIASLYHYRET
jgi:hypothetical protein